MGRHLLDLRDLDRVRAFDSAKWLCDRLHSAALSAFDKEVEDLTGEEKLALAHYAGAPTEANLGEDGQFKLGITAAISKLDGDWYVSFKDRCDQMQVVMLRRNLQHSAFRHS